MNKEVLTLQPCETHITDDALLVSKLQRLIDAIERLCEEIMASNIAYDDEGVLKPKVVRAILAACRRKKSVSEEELRKSLGLCPSR